ncbi:MAG TPA: sigma-70 family RNA polymerase sigma factor [Bellilinea sp.]|jgi:RNA polymerase sigma-70 factor (ECF subfamily)|nr:sigma-70 family RNA polymerase sigma factor [Bellilinea sp.]
MKSSALELKHPADELALVARAKADTAAVAALYDHYFPLIYKYVLYRVSDAQIADDLVSQIFERMLSDLDRYQPELAPFGAWLFGIARHVVGNFYRTKKRQNWLSLEGIFNLPNNDPIPEEAFLKIEQGDHLLQSLAKLSDRERDLIGLKFAGGLTNREISTLTRLTEANVGVILYRAIQRLRTELTKEEVNND